MNLEAIGQAGILFILLLIGAITLRARGKETVEQCRDEDGLDENLVEKAKQRIGCIWWGFILLFLGILVRFVWVAL